MKINGYEIALSEAELEDIINNKTVVVDFMGKDFAGYQALSEGDKKALTHLVNAANLMNDVFLEQDHELNYAQKKALEIAAKDSSHAQKALQFFKLYNGVEGLNGVAKEPIELFHGIKGNLGRNFYPSDLGVEEFQQIILNMLKAGKVDEVKKIVSVRTMVRRFGDELKAIDYTQYFAPQFSAIANELELAAHYTTDELFKEYLGWQAQALIQNNEQMDLLADKHWALMQDTPIEFTLARENYNDELTAKVFEHPELADLLKKYDIEVNSKDGLGIRVGIVNQAGTKLLLTFKEHMCELAKLMPLSDRYEQNVACAGDLKQTMVDADLVTLTGNYAAARGGLTTAENLPNNDKLSIKMGNGRRNVYHRQVRQSGDKAKEKKLLELLLSPQSHQYFDVEADHLFVIGHENGHSLGPDSSYQSALGSYKHIIEEHKADVVSIAFMPEYAKIGVIDEHTLKQVYTTWVFYRLFLKAEPNPSLPHRIADLIQFNYLLEHEVISFDEQGRLRLDFDKFAQVMHSLLAETIEVQLSKSPAAAKKFIDRYAVWGPHSQRIAKVHAELGLKPYKDIRTHLKV